MTKRNPKLDWDRMTKIAREEDLAKEEAALQYYQSQRDGVLQSVLERLKPQQETSPVPLDLVPLALAKTANDKQLKRGYRIKVISEEAHVTIETDENHIILHFLGEIDLNAVKITVFRLDNDAETTCEIRGRDARFALRDIGLGIREIDRVMLRVKIGNQQVERKLYEPV